MLLAVLFFVFTALFLATYLLLTQGEYTYVARSQTWNTSMVLAEAGVEDAFAFVNQNAGQSSALTNWTATATANGWSTIINTSSNQVFSISRSPDTNLGSYTVYVTNNLSGTNGPSILSIGTAKWNSSDVTFSGPNAVRKVYVQTLGSSQLEGGVIAYAGMDFKGNNVTIDSFNSADPNHSIWQSNFLYHGTAYGIWASSLSLNTNILPSRTADVTVATDGSIINVGNANIAGYVDTAPGGTVSLNANGSVGDLNWALVTQSSGIEPGHARDDMNKQYFSKTLPTPTNAAQATWWPVLAVSTNIGGVSYSYIITNKLANSNLVYYAMSSLGSSLFINASNVVLYLTNGMSYSGNSTLTLNTNADVQIWSTGNMSTSGNAVINNFTQYTHAFSIYDVAGYPISLTFGGNAPERDIFTPQALP